MMRFAFQVMFAVSRLLISGADLNATFEKTEGNTSQTLASSQGAVTISVQSHSRDFLVRRM